MFVDLGEKNLFNLFIIVLIYLVGKFRRKWFWWENFRKELFGGKKKYMEVMFWCEILLV